MDEVELSQHARDARTGLRRLAPEIEAARDKIVDHFEDKPFAELKEFVQQLLENEEDEAKRLGALAARVYMLRKRIIDFEETVELVPPDEPSAELNVADDETTGRNWARVGVLENCEVNGMRLPEVLSSMFRFRRPAPDRCRPCRDARGSKFRIIYRNIRVGRTRHDGGE